VNGHFDMNGTRLFGPIQLDVPSIKWTCILGASGVGKSTLLRAMLGLETGGSFEGEISANDGLPLEGRVSYMAQSDLLLPWLTVLGNVVLGARLRGDVPDLERAQSLLQQVGLHAHQDKKPKALSGGMRQRAALARTLMEDRPIVFLDEPFSALDAGTRADMQELAAQTLAGKTVVLVTHDPAEAVRIGHQIIVLSKDKALIWPTPDTEPLRTMDAPETVACQTKLLAHLRKARV
jgi:putative hydroxymethylpyrimidine transport system ATP-binding protein